MCCMIQLSNYHAAMLCGMYENAELVGSRWQDEKIELTLKEGFGLENMSVEHTSNGIRILISTLMNAGCLKIGGEHFKGIQ